jgi:hypothetical protein
VVTTIVEEAFRQATFILPTGSYRFPADKGGGQYWNGDSNHCSIPGCPYRIFSWKVKRRFI